MNNYDNMYYRKVVNPDKAVQFIKPGDGIIFPIMPGEPPLLLDAISKYEKLQNNTIYRMLPSFPTLKLPENKIKQVSLFLSGMDRKEMNNGNIDLLPNNFSDIPSLLLSREPNPIIMATVSPMDRDGNFSLGTSPSYIVPLIKHAKHIILEVNKFMPRTFGKDNLINISQVSAIIENDVELPTLPTPEISKKDLIIGKYISNLVNDGDTLQIGFGSIPNAVMEFLKDKKDLGIYTEMLPDKLVDLYESGTITNKYKEVCPGYSVATFAVGSKKLYDFINNNHDIRMLSCDYVNNQDVIKRLDNLVSINSTVEIDFLGQCNSERIRNHYYSSTGGQTDFMKGVKKTAHGKGIICMYSTAKNDTVSTIVPVLYTGSPVSTSKNDTDIVVTEYGIAYLKGKTIKERTKELINIAHPKFKDYLYEEALKLKYI